MEEDPSESCYNLDKVVVSFVCLTVLFEDCGTLGWGRGLRLVVWSPVWAMTLVSGRLECQYHFHGTAS